MYLRRIFSLIHEWNISWFIIFKKIENKNSPWCFFNFSEEMNMILIIYLIQVVKVLKFTFSFRKCKTFSGYLMNGIREDKTHRWR